MAFAVWQGTIVDESGNIQKSASIEVRRESTGALAAIYSDRDGSTPLANPAAADENGFIRFYAAAGAVKITATKSEFSRTWRHVPIGTLAELDELPAALIHHDITPAEIAAGVTPVNYAYAPGDVRRYGARGDGVTDDTAAIQRAVDVSIASSGSVEVIIPAGEFLTSARITINGSCVIRGLGWGSVLKGASGGSYIILLVQSDDFSAIDGVRLQDFVVDGNGGGQLDAGIVTLNNARGFLIDHLWIRNATAAAGPQGVNGISFSSGTIGGQGPVGVIRDCLIENTSKAAINWTTQAASGLIIGNTIRAIAGNGAAPGIQINGGFNGRVIGNYITGTEGPGILVVAVGTVPPIDSADTVIAGNIVSGCGALSSTLPDGIVVANATATVDGRMIISGNIVVNSGGNGILIQNTLNAVVTSNLIRDNRVNGIVIDDSTHVVVAANRCTGNNVADLPTSAGIQILGTCSHISITDNHCSDDKPSPKQRYGISIDGSANVSHLLVADNHLDGNVNGPMLADGMTSPCRISIVASRQTADGVASTIQYFTLPDDSSMMIRVHTIGKKTDGSQRALYSREGLFYRDGSGVAQQGATTTLGADIESDPSWGGVQFGMANNQVSIQVIGAASTTISWRAEIDAISV